MVDTLQGSVESIGSGHGLSTCSNCVEHRSALIKHRDFNTPHSNTARASYEKSQELVKKCQEDLNAALLQNGKLHAQLMCNTDLYWRSREVLRMNHENEHMKVQLQTLEAECNASKQEKAVYVEKVKQDKAVCIEQLNSAQETIQRLEAEKLGIEQGTVYDLDPVLKSNFENAFVINEGNEEDENRLYENFINSIPPAEQELNLDLMYQMDHDGKHISSTELNRFRSKGGRLCRQAFARCLRSIGGISKKCGTKRIWLNIKTRLKKNTLGLFTHLLYTQHPWNCTVRMKTVSYCLANSNPRQHNSSV
jgi:hypothetical protein